jgi:glycosyltransferase involved in cell wall biosynthesis
VIGNGNIAWVDLSQFNPERAGLREGAAALREKLGLSEAAFVFGFMGRLNRDKGINELVDAFHQLDDDACRLVLFGRHDETALVEPETRETIETDPRIIAAGWTDEVPCALTIFDALVLPSYREGFPNVLLQGSAMGVPLIATDINGSNEIVVPGETGYLVPARDAGALADAMRELIRLEGAARSAMGAAGKARVEALYEQSKYRAALMSFYFAALGAEHR